VYWGAQFIPSGWISVLFGLVPAITAILTAVFLKERAFTPAKAIGVLLGLAGLVVIFGHSADLGRHTILGVAAVLLSVVLNCVSMVWVQRSGEKLSPLAVTSGGLMISVGLYLMTWLAVDGIWPAQLPLRAMLSITYLAVFGSAIGFMLYYYLLKHLAASKVGLIMLVTPVTALLLGHLFNGEVITAAVWWGTALIVSGLASHQWGDTLWDRLSSTGPGNGEVGALDEEEEK
jgi:drug/metabolite transporter (DMT)-like permease